MAPNEPNLRSEELAGSWRELEAAGEEAEELAGGLARERLRWRPAPERWSIAECLDHLVRTGEAYLEAMDTTIGEARRDSHDGGGSYRPSLVGRWLVRVLEPPPGLRVRAPRIIRPRTADAEGADDPLAAFLGLRPRFRRRLEAADGLDLGRIRMSSPFFSFVRFDLGSAFRIVAAHERRHLWQARQVRRAEGFPEG